MVLKISDSFFLLLYMSNKKKENLICVLDFCLIDSLLLFLRTRFGRMFLCPKLSAFAPKCVFYSPLIVCICPKSCVFAPNFLSLNFPLIVCICPKSCESSPNQALNTPNIKKKKFGAKTHDLGGI